MATKKTVLIFQFKITLLDTSPKIWRKIQLLETATFWDLHIAIQDAMGWLNYHLHGFELPQLDSKDCLRVGIPDDSGMGVEIAAGWETPISNHFVRPGTVASYEYDFGDSWEHEVLLDGIFLKEGRGKYPTCVAGERACPPEDCSGIGGFYDLLEILKDPDHDEHEEMVDWLKNHQKKYYPYDPEFFDPAKVKFSDPEKSLKQALQQISSW
jgi:hypothetical protein